MESIKSKIFVEAIEEKAWNDRTFWEIQGIEVEKDQAWKAVCWSSTLHAKIVLEKDNTFEYQETEKNGYTNRKIINVADADGTFAASAKSGGGGRVAKADPAKTNSIERQVAAKEAVQLIINNIAPIEDFESVASMVLKFIKDEK